VKRDPRLRPLSARRSERRLHGLRLTDAYKLAQRIGETFGLRMTYPHFKAHAAHAARVEQAHARFVRQLQRTASQVAHDLTEQLRRDGMLYGEAHVHCGWDEATDLPTVQRVPPEDVMRWPAKPLTQEQADRLDGVELWSP
jgi:hypothetical protein